MVFEDSSSSSESSGGSRVYPPFPPLSPFHSEKARDHKVAGQLVQMQRTFNITFTPIEREAAAYYSSRLCAAETRGETKGTVVGLILGVVLMKSQRRAMFPFKEMGKVIGMPARSQVKLSRLSNAVCTVYFAKTVGITVSSVLEFNRISEDQKKDPNIQRYLKAKRDWVEKRRSDIVAGIAPPKIAIPTTEEVARTEELIRSEQQGRNVGDHDDQQSLGGAFYDDHKPQDSSVGTGASDTKYTSEVYAMHMKRQKELEMARAEREQGDSRQDDDVVDDILSAGAAEPAAPQGQAKAPGGGWKNVQSRPSGGSAWDRLRRGETAQPGSSSGYDDAAPQSAAWPRRPDMKGFGSSGPAYEAKEDSFSFTGDTNREQAKEEAQREFDERIERERNGQGADGFVGEGRWNSK